MNLYTSLRTAIRNATLKALSYDFPTMPVIFTHQNGPEPAESYAAIYVLSVNQIGHSQASTLADLSEQIVFSNVYESDVQVSFFGSLSGDAIHAFINNVNNNPLVLEEFKLNNIALMRKTQIRSNPQMRETEWVDSFNMTMTVNYAIATTQPVDVVEQVILESQIINEGDVLISNETYTVPEDAVIIP